MTTVSGAVNFGSIPDRGAGVIAKWRETQETVHFCCPTLTDLGVIGSASE